MRWRALLEDAVSSLRVIIDIEWVRTNTVLSVA